MRLFFSAESFDERLSVELLSDIRVMDVYALDSDAVYAQILSKAAAYGLMRYAEESEVLRSIEVMDVNEATPAMYSNRSLTAAIFGAVIGFAGAFFFVIFVLFLISDAVYVPEEAEERYKLPVIGIMAPAGVEVARLPEIFITEYRDNVNALLKKGNRLRIVTDLSKEGGDKIKVELEVLRDKIRHTLETAGVNMPDIVVRGVSGEGGRVISIGEEHESNGSECENPVNDVILIAIRAGVEQGVFIEHLISQLKARGEEASGILFMCSDMKFIRRYYRL